MNLFLAFILLGSALNAASGYPTHSESTLNYPYVRQFAMQQRHGDDPHYHQQLYHDDEEEEDSHHDDDHDDHDDFYSRDYEPSQYRLAQLNGQISSSSRTIQIPPPTHVQSVKPQAYQAPPSIYYKEASNFPPVEIEYDDYFEDNNFVNNNKNNYYYQPISAPTQPQQNRYSPPPAPTAAQRGYVAPKTTTTTTPAPRTTTTTQAYQQQYYTEHEELEEEHPETPATSAPYQPSPYYAMEKLHVTDRYSPDQQQAQSAKYFQSANVNYRTQSDIDLSELDKEPIVVDTTLPQSQQYQPTTNYQPDSTATAIPDYIRNMIPELSKYSDQSNNRGSQDGKTKYVVIIVEPSEYDKLALAPQPVATEAKSRDTFDPYYVPTAPDYKKKYPMKTKTVTTTPSPPVPTYYQYTTPSPYYAPLPVQQQQYTAPIVYNQQPQVYNPYAYPTPVVTYQQPQQQLPLPQQYYNNDGVYRLSAQKSTPQRVEETYVPPESSSSSSSSSSPIVSLSYQSPPVLTAPVPAVKPRTAVKKVPVVEDRSVHVQNINTNRGSNIAKQSDSNGQIASNQQSQDIQQSQLSYNQAKESVVYDRISNIQTLMNKISQSGIV